MIFFRDSWGFFRGGRAIDEVQHARGVILRATELGFVAIALQQLNREHGHGHIVGTQCHDAFGVFGGAPVVAQLQAGFHQCAVNAHTLLRFRIFLQESFEVAHQSRAVISCGINGSLKLVFRR